MQHIIGAYAMHWRYCGLDMHTMQRRIGGMVMNRDSCDVCDMQNLTKYVEIAARKWYTNEYLMDGYYRVCYKCADNASTLLEITRWVTNES